MRKLLVALALCGVSSAGHAATFLVTYTGTVSSGSDITGVFATPGASLAGYAFTAAYTLEYPLAGALESNVDGLHTLIGGTSVGTPSPVSATLSINGVTRGIDGTYRGEADLANNWYGSDILTYSAEDLTLSGGIMHSAIVYASVSSATNTITTSTDFGDLLSYLAGPGDNRAGVFQFWGFDQQRNTTVEFASGYLSTDKVSVAAVPEPATWAMFIGGFGMIGGVLRQRKAISTNVRFA